MAMLLLLFLALPPQILALTYQNLWKVPDGDKSDLSQTFQSGQTLPLSWQALNTSTNDLWVTTFNYNEVQYSSLIAKDIDISVDGSFAWTIKIPDAQLSKTAKYVLRFKPAAFPRTSYDHLTVEISSPGFLVLAAAAAVASTSPTSATTTTTTTPASSATTTPTASTTASGISSSSLTSPATATSTSTAPTSSDGAAPAITVPAATSATLSAGAKAGIGVGAAAAALALAGLFAWLCFFRRKGRRDDDERQQQQKQQQQQQQQFAWTAAATGHEKQEPQGLWSEVPVMMMMPAELQGGSVAELPAGEGGRGRGAF